MAEPRKGRVAGAQRRKGQDAGAWGGAEQVWEARVEKLWKSRCHGTGCQSSDVQRPARTSTALGDSLCGPCVQVVSGQDPAAGVGLWKALAAMFPVFTRRVISEWIKE